MGHHASKTKLQCSNYDDNGQTFTAHNSQVTQFCRTFAVSTYFGSSICHITMFTNPSLVVSIAGFFGGNVRSQVKGTSDYVVFSTSNVPLQRDQLVLLQEFIKSESWKTSPDMETMSYENVANANLSYWGHALLTYENNFQTLVCIAGNVGDAQDSKFYLWVLNNSASVERSGDGFRILFPGDTKIAGSETTKIITTPIDKTEDILKCCIIVMTSFLALTIIGVVFLKDQAGATQKIMRILRRQHGSVRFKRRLR